MYKICKVLLAASFAMGCGSSNSKKEDENKEEDNIENETTDEADGTPAPLFVDVLSAFDAIAAFLTTLLDALSAVPEPSDTTEPPSNVAARFEMSFKLRVFQSILITVSDAADGENDDAVPPVVEDALDTLAAQQQPLEALA